jgi:hypothetical protein
MLLFRFVFAVRPNDMQFKPASEHSERITNVHTTDVKQHVSGYLTSLWPDLKHFNVSYRQNLCHQSHRLGWTAPSIIHLVAATTLSTDLQQDGQL